MQRDDSGLDTTVLEHEDQDDPRGDYGFEDCGVDIRQYRPQDDSSNSIDVYLDDALDSVNDAILDKLSEPTVSREDLIRIVHFDDVGEFDVDFGLIYPISGTVPEGARLAYAIDVDDIASYEEADYSDADEETLLAYIEEALEAFKGIALAELTADQKFLLYQHLEVGADFVVYPSREIHGRDAAIVFYVDFPSAPQPVED